MNRFIQRHRAAVTGILHGFDRLVFRGTFRRIAYVDGMRAFLSQTGVLLKDFSDYALALTERLKKSTRSIAEQSGRQLEFLASSSTNKEARALEIAGEDSVRSGLVCILGSLEPCMSYDIYRDAAAKKLRLVLRQRKCLHYYHYFIHPVFGWMSARIQTWLPFRVQICMNGREYLGVQLDRAGLDYVRRDNCFPAIPKLKRAQSFMARFLKTNWPSALDEILSRLDPLHDFMFGQTQIPYYWSVYQSEYATDLMFRDNASLAEVYRPLVLHGITTFSSGDVMRFLGGKVHGRFLGEIVSDYKDRPEGVRLKHAANGNSVKIYDKQGSVLRVETTINNPHGIKVYRPIEGDPQGEKDWRPLRKGIADLHRRAQVSEAANRRYLDALAVVDTSRPLGELLTPLTQSVHSGATRVRGLHPWSKDDLDLIRAVLRGEFSIAGFRCRDLEPHLYGDRTSDPIEAKRRSRRIGRLLRMLRVHGLIQRIPKSYRYVLTKRGRELLAAIAAADLLTLEQIRRAA